MNVEDPKTNNWIIHVLAFPHWTLCPDGNLQGGEPAPVGTKLKQPSHTICWVILFQVFCIKTNPNKATVRKSKNLIKIVRFPKSEPFLLFFIEQHREQSEGITWDGAKAVFLTGKKAVHLTVHTSETIAPDINTTT